MGMSTFSPLMQSPLPLMLVLVLGVASAASEEAAVNAFGEVSTGPNVVVKSATARGLVRKLPTVASILAEHDKTFTDTVTRKFDGESLVYVTPWNSKGYDAAKVCACWRWVPTLVCGKCVGFEQVAAAGGVNTGLPRARVWVGSGCIAAT